MNNLSKNRERFIKDINQRDNLIMMRWWKKWMSLKTKNKINNRNIITNRMISLIIWVHLLTNQASQIHTIQFQQQNRLLVLFQVEEEAEEGEEEEETTEEEKIIMTHKEISIRKNLLLNNVSMSKKTKLYIYDYIFN